MSSGLGSAHTKFVFVPKDVEVLWPLGKPRKTGFKVLEAALGSASPTTFILATSAASFCSAGCLRGAVPNDARDGLKRDPSKGALDGFEPSHDGIVMAACVAAERACNFFKPA